ncbi:MAG TPA: SDR family oxidoreductase [Pseudorhodoferax sp.]|nr:SDR family oxidoreductase [Pseudorhodoferax sp.]
MAEPAIPGSPSSVSSAPTALLAPDLLRGKRVLVTGGGSGLGLAMATRFAQLGATPVLCGRGQEVLVAAAAGLAMPAEVEVCDLRDADQVERMFERIWQRGPLDVLVNNAAATFIAQTERLSARALDAILGPTLHGAAYCTLAAGRRWIDAGRRGCVLSILSTSVRTGRAFTVPSAMAKSGLQAMTRSLAVEWGPRGIRLVAIAPGSFPTEATQRQLMPQARRNGADVARRVPLGRHGQPAELAELAAFLISDGALYINGETVAIDGGAHLRSSGAEDLLDWDEARWEEHRRQRP